MGKTVLLNKTVNTTELRNGSSHG